jgi:hypothetical protein
MKMIGKYSVLETTKLTIDCCKVQSNQINENKTTNEIKFYDSDHLYKSFAKFLIKNLFPSINVEELRP